MRINIFLYKHARKVPISISRNMSIYFFVSFPIVLVAPFMNKPESCVKSETVSLFRFPNLKLDF